MAALLMTMHEQASLYAQRAQAQVGVLSTLIDACRRNRLSEMVVNDKVNLAHDQYHASGRCLINAIRNNDDFWTWQDGLRDQVLRRTWSVLYTTQQAGSPLVCH
jgi:hypothetical protein